MTAISNTIIKATNIIVKILNDVAEIQNKIEEQQPALGTVQSTHLQEILSHWGSKIEF